jgi:hypothetical protein
MRNKEREAKMKAKATEITIERAEGLTEDCVTVTISARINGDIFNAANRILSLWATTVANGYDKCDFRVKFEDGETYKGRYDLHQDEDADIRQHMIDFLAYASDPERSMASDGTMEYAKQFLDLHELSTAPHRADELAAVATRRSEAARKAVATRKARQAEGS